MVEYKVQNYDASTGKVTITDLEQAKIDEIKEYYSDAKVNERKLNQIKNIRNEKLKSTDWMANSDVTMSDEWKKYRQDLRDITSTVTDDAVRYAMGDDMFHAGWPTKPS